MPTGETAVAELSWEVETSMVEVARYGNMRRLRRGVL